MIILVVICMCVRKDVCMCTSIELCVPVCVCVCVCANLSVSECTHRLQSDLPELCTPRHVGPVQDPGQDAVSRFSVWHPTVQAQGDRGGDKDDHQVGVVRVGWEGGLLNCFVQMMMYI